MNIDSSEIPQTQQQSLISTQRQVRSIKKATLLHDIMIFFSGCAIMIILMFIYQYMVPNNPSSIEQQQQTSPLLEQNTDTQNSIKDSIHFFLSSIIATHTLSAEHQIADMQYQKFKSIYQIEKYSQKQFCVVVPTYNNAEKDRCIMNIDSIMDQVYNNFKVVIIDDASTDSTYSMISEYMEGLSPQKKAKIFLKKNTENKKALYNIYWAAHNFCSDQSIMTIIDGDDFLIGNYIFKLFNAIYHREKVWLVYSNFLFQFRNIGLSQDYPDEVKEKGTFRSVPFKLSHQHTFYTKLFRKIKEEDLKDGQKWWEATYDLAIYFPMAEMARKKVRYLPIPTYYYQIDTGINTHQINSETQRNNERKIRGKLVYEAIDSLD